MNDGLGYIATAIIVAALLFCITKCSSDTDKNRMECIKMGKSVEDCQHLFHN